MILAVASWGVPTAITDAVASCSLLSHFESMRKGVVDFADVGYYFAMVVFMIAAAKTVTDGRRGASKGVAGLVLVGAMGKREDHLLGNVFRALDLGVEIVTEFGRFVPVADKASFRVSKGTPVSVFAVDPATRMTSTGLEWSLDGVKFKNLYCATLNRASAARVTLATNRPVLVFIASGETT